jgi:hypothetical protein
MRVIQRGEKEREREEGGETEGEGGEREMLSEKARAYKRVSCCLYRKRGRGWIEKGEEGREGVEGK